MRGYDPGDEYDVKEAQRMGAEDWMLAELARNPEYVSWGPGEDYMKMPSEQHGWDVALAYDTWPEAQRLSLDELNEVVHFYFQVKRDAEDCEACGASGHNPETHRISEDFYDFAGTGRKWCDNITQDEAQALFEKGRLWGFKSPPSAEDVNNWGKTDIGHDAINRWILIETRAKRLGVFGECIACGGAGYRYTAPKPALGLVLWVLHPRKGASRGVIVSEVKQEELPAVYAFLRQAAQRNADRFARIPN